MVNIFEIIIIILLGIVFGISLFEVLIPYFHRIKYGQSIRSEGPSTHYIKKGTPTMGGIIIFTCTMFLWIIFLIFNYKERTLNFYEILLIFISFFGFLLVGFIDDYLIVIKKNNDGLKPKIKFIMQLFISAICYSIVIHIRKSSDIDFFGVTIDLKFIYGILLLISYSGFSNATNLTDGLDGLLGGSYLLILVGIIYLSFTKFNYNVMYFSLALLISLITFLLYNLPKAKIFMGDTGSLSLGAVLLTLLIILNMEILIFVFGFVYLIETFSVIIQVWFFKKTKGERLFKMTPIHHHFELIGYKEFQINIIFWIITLIFTILGVYLGVKIF